jgi:hypothetical protein
MVRTVAALNMLPAEGDEGTPNKLPGYQRGARIVRVASGVSNVMAKSLESPGARMAINKISYGAVDRDEMSQAA